MRVVEASGSEVGGLLEIARGCGRYPRLRFIIVADHVDFPLRGQLAADLMAGLSGSGPSGWPSNTLLYMGATATSTINMDPIVSRFGILQATNFLTDEEWSGVLTQLAAQRQQPAPTAEQIAAAADWAKSRGGKTIRSAVQFLERASL